MARSWRTWPAMCCRTANSCGACGMYMPPPIQTLVRGDMEVDAGALVLGQPAGRKHRGDVGLVRRLVVGEAGVAIDAVHRHFRAGHQLGREGAEVDRQPLDDRDHRLADVRLVVAAVRVRTTRGGCCASARAETAGSLRGSGGICCAAWRPSSRAIRSCIWRVTCGTMPIIRCIVISWPRWCISCSFADEQHLEAALGRRRRARRHRHLLGEERFGQPLEVRRERVALGLQERDDLGLGARLGFFGPELRP